MNEHIEFSSKVPGAYESWELEALKKYVDELPTNPCILHLNGGYSDPLLGKGDRLKPWYEGTQ